jgi:hypothetical protein
VNYSILRSSNFTFILFLARHPLPLTHLLR